MKTDYKITFNPKGSYTKLVTGSALYMPALVTTRFEPNIKGYYHHLIDDNGLKKVQAICAVMRKLLHAIHGMLRTNKEFYGARFYAFPVNSNS